MYYTCTQIVDEIRQHIPGFRPHEFVEEFVNFYKCYVLSSSPVYIPILHFLLLQVVNYFYLGLGILCGGMVLTWIYNFGSGDVPHFSFNWS